MSEHANSVRVRVREYEGGKNTHLLSSHGAHTAVHLANVHFDLRQMLGLGHLAPVHCVGTRGEVKSESELACEQSDARARAKNIDLQRGGGEG